MRDTTRRSLPVVCGLLTAGLSYVLVAESVLPGWVATVLVVGGYYGAVVGVIGVVGAFGPLGQRLVNVVLGLAMFLPLLVYPYESLYVFMFGVSLVLFGMTLQDVVSGVAETDDG